MSAQVPIHFRVRNVESLPTPAPARYRPGWPREPMPGLWSTGECGGSAGEALPVTPMATQSHRTVRVSERGLRRALQDFLRYNLVTLVPQSAIGCCLSCGGHRVISVGEGLCVLGTMTCACGSPALTLPLCLGCEAPTGTWGGGTYAHFSLQAGEALGAAHYLLPSPGGHAPRFWCPVPVCSLRGLVGCGHPPLSSLPALPVAKGALSSDSGPCPQGSASPSSLSWPSTPGLGKLWQIWLTTGVYK